MGVNGEGGASEGGRSTPANFAAPRHEGAGTTAVLLGCHRMLIDVFFLSVRDANERFNSFDRTLCVAREVLVAILRP
jgi:hypothetical protein